MDATVQISTPLHFTPRYLLAYFVDGVCPPLELERCEMGLVAFLRDLIQLAIQGMEGEGGGPILRTELSRAQVVRGILILHWRCRSNADQIKGMAIVVADEAPAS